MTQGGKSGGTRGAAWIVGGLTLCCGAHLVAAAGGLAVLGGFLSESVWLIAAALAAIAVVIALLARRNRCDTPGAEPR